MESQLSQKQQFIWAFNSNSNPWDGSKPVWKQYSTKDCQSIEKAFQEKLQLADIGDYKIIFAKSLQVHKKDSSRQRQVTRFDEAIIVPPKPQQVFQAQSAPQFNLGMMGNIKILDPGEDYKFSTAAFLNKVLLNQDDDKLHHKQDEQVEEVKDQDVPQLEQDVEQQVPAVINTYDTNKKSMCPVIRRWKEIMILGGKFTKQQFKDFKALKCSDDGSLIGFNFDFLKKILNEVHPLEKLNGTFSQIFFLLNKVLQSQPKDLLTKIVNLYTIYYDMARTINSILRNDDISQAYHIGAFSYLLYSFIHKMTASYNIKQSKLLKKNKIVYKCIQLNEPQLKVLIDFYEKVKHLPKEDEGKWFQWNAFTTANENKEIISAQSHCNAVFEIQIPLYFLSVESLSGQVDQIGEVLLNSGSVFSIEQYYEVIDTKHYFKLLHHDLS